MEAALPVQPSPSVRARHMKALLASVDGLGTDEAAAIRGRLAPALLSEVERRAGRDWLPMAGNLALTRAIHDVLGAEAFRAFFRRHTLASLSGPLFGQLVAALVGVLGGSPASWAAWMPRAWGILFGACGTWAVEERGPGSARLWYEEAPFACLDDRVWLDSVAASVAALADLNRVAGDAEVVSVDRAGGLAIFELRWSPAVRPA